MALEACHGTVRPPRAARPPPSRAPCRIAPAPPPAARRRSGGRRPRAPARHQRAATPARLDAPPARSSRPAAPAARHRIAGHHAGAVGIEIRRRLVEHQQSRRRRQHPGDRDPLLLPARETVRMPALEPGEADGGERLRHARPHRHERPAQVLEAEGDVVPDALHHELARGVLEHDPGADLGRRRQDRRIRDGDLPIVDRARSPATPPGTHSAGARRSLEPACSCRSRTARRRAARSRAPPGARRPETPAGSPPRT